VFPARVIGAGARGRAGAAVGRRGLAPRRSFRALLIDGFGWRPEAEGWKFRLREVVELTQQRPFP